MDTENYLSTPSSYSERPSSPRKDKWAFCNILFAPKWGNVSFLTLRIELLIVTSSNVFATCVTTRCAWVFIYAHRLEFASGDLYGTCTVRIRFHFKAAPGSLTQTPLRVVFLWPVCLFMTI